MTKRKSLNDALSPEEESFLSSGRVSPAERQAQPKPIPERKIVASADQGATILPPVPDLPDAGLSTLNVRIEPSIVGAVLRASMVRKIQKQKPYAQREIVAEALRQWLSKYGYLK